MGDLWQGQHPWSAFGDTPAWDRGHGEARQRREPQHRQRFEPARRQDDGRRGEEFVQQAIQHQYEK